MHDLARGTSVDSKLLLGMASFACIERKMTKSLLLENGKRLSQMLALNYRKLNENAMDSVHSTTSSRDR
jgi:hypothetical protein